MRNVTKWSVLVLSIFALSFAACGGDDNEDDNNGGSGGSAGSAGTGGTGGTGGTAGQGGTGGTAGTGGTGGTAETACVDTNDESAECTACVQDAVEICAGTGGVCEADWNTFADCAVTNGCVDQQGNLDQACVETNCSTEFDTYVNCLFTDCDELIACFPAEGA